MSAGSSILIAEYKGGGQSDLRIALCWFAGLSFFGAFAGAVLDRNSGNITQYFMAVQDAPVLFFMGAAYVAVAWLAWSKSANSFGGRIDRLDVVRFAWITAVASGCAILAIRHWAYVDFALSADEFLAEFDSGIIADGKLFARLAPEWRDYAPALRPVLSFLAPDNAFFISSYLPVNAALRAIFVAVGAPGLQGAVLAGVAVVALFGVTRRIWPNRPDAAVVAVIVLVSSSQFLITAATPYAMTAHLALNLVWLWLFLRDTPTSHVAAAGVGFAACGLHQVAFHPLVVAPFVLFLFWDKRWKLAAFYTVVYAVSALFWISYWSILLRAVGAPMQQAAEVGIPLLIQRIPEMMDLSLVGLVHMLLNLFRLLSWQNLLFFPLIALALAGWRSRDRTVTCLALGVIATFAFMLLITPSQGHGWGYRYLHGCLGSLALIAAFGWIKATDGDAAKTGNTTGNMTGSSWWVLLSSAVISVVVLLPWRAYQAHAFVAPYAAAAGAIERSRADVVIVDFLDIWYGQDFVRNDPFLRSSPKVLNLLNLDETMLRDLCGRYDIAIFDRQDALVYGLRIVPGLPEPYAGRIRKNREVMGALGCGRPFGVRSLSETPR